MPSRLHRWTSCWLQLLHCCFLRLAVSIAYIQARLSQVHSKICGLAFPHSLTQLNSRQLDSTRLYTHLNSTCRDSTMCGVWQWHLQQQRVPCLARGCCRCCSFRFSLSFAYLNCSQADCHQRFLNVDKCVL